MLAFAAEAEVGHRIDDRWLSPKWQGLLPFSHSPAANWRV